VFSNERGEILGAAFKKPDFISLIKDLNSDSLRFHMQRGDFKKWAKLSLKDEKLSKSISKIKYKKHNEQELRLNLIDAFNKSIKKQ
jgi:hypothetical protein